MIVAFVIGFLAMCLLVLGAAYLGRVARYNVLALRLAREQKTRVECEGYARILEGQLYKIRTMCAAEPAQRTSDAVRAAIIKARAESARKALS